MDEPSTSHQALEATATDSSKSTGTNDDDNSRSSIPSQQQIDDADLDKMMTVEEFLLKSKTSLTEYEKHMFLDAIDSDCLVVCAKYVTNVFSIFYKFHAKINICRGIPYERVVLNLLKIYCDPGNLIIVVNAADYEEKYYRSYLDPKFVHESSTNGNERYLLMLSIAFNDEIIDVILVSVN